MLAFKFNVDFRHILVCAYDVINKNENTNQQKNGIQICWLSHQNHKKKSMQLLSVKCVKDSLYAYFYANAHCERYVDFGNIHFVFLANPPIEIGFSSRSELRSFHQLKINANVSNRMKRSSHKIKKQLKIVKSRTVTFQHEQKSIV